MSEADAYRREKQIKAWARHKKVAVIQRENPNWIDVSRTRLELLQGQ